jgi:hypothetical protein
MSAWGRYERLAGVGGLVSVVLLVVQAALLVFGTTGETESTQQLVSYLRENRTLFLAATVLEGLGLSFVLWFLSGLVLVLRGHDGESRALALLVLSAGIVFVLLILIEDAAFVAAAYGVEDSGSALAVNVLWDFGRIVAGVYGRFPVAVLLFASAAAILRTRRLPSWLAWLACLAGATNLSLVGGVFVDSGIYAPANELEHVIGVIPYEAWILFTSIAMIRGSVREDD